MSYLKEIFSMRLRPVGYCLIILMFAVVSVFATDINSEKIGVLNNSIESKTVGDKNNSQEKIITFDFPNTELSVFARFVAKLSRKMLIGQELLKGNIDIKSQTKLDLKEVKEIFRTVLFSKGLDYTENDYFMEIIQRSDSIVKVYQINYLKSSDLAKALSQMFRMSFNVGNQPVNIQITSIDDANSLMVLAPKNLQIEIEKSIKKLDKRLKQVMLNVLVLELGKTSNFGFGVDVGFSDGTYVTGIDGGGSLANDTAAGRAIATPLSSGKMTFGTSGISSAGGVSFQNGNWAVNVQAVEDYTKLKVLTQPRIITADNQKAEIKLGKKEPYVTTSVSIGSSGEGSVTGNSSTSSSISTEDIGIDIEITPRINNLKSVTLEMKLKITSKTGTLSVQSGTTKNSHGATVPNYNHVPQIGHRIINNTSNVSNGEVLVLGGLLKNDKTVIKSAPPFVGELPWVGWMFEKESEAVAQTELMVFVSPTVIYDDEEGNLMTKDETKTLLNYDPETKVELEKMLKGKKTLNDNVFNIFDYFSNGKYRSEQGFIPQFGDL